MVLDRLLGTGRWERLAVLAVAAATLGLIVAMPAWRGGDMVPAEQYALSPADLAAWIDEVQAAHGVDREGQSVVRPPPGDVPLIARRYGFSPALELRQGETYRLHVGAEDVVHSIVLAGIERLLVPGRVEVITVTAEKAGMLDLQCGEYCGIGHSRMKASIRVLP